jgi:hypothetical protein
MRAVTPLLRLQRVKAESRPETTADATAAAGGLRLRGRDYSLAHRSWIICNI